MQTFNVSSRSSFEALRRLARSTAADERCDFCNVKIPPIHRHLLEIANRRIICACDPCAMRFENVIGGRFGLIPRDTFALKNFQITDAQWENFSVPINLAFFFHNSVTGKIVALYPSPAGATESLLTLETWNELASENPVLSGIQPDVEALLINRVGKTRAYFIAPMDVCYALVGLIRTHWRGFSGGEAAWREIENFFARLNASPAPLAREQHFGARPVKSNPPRPARHSLSQEVVHA